MHSNDVLLAHEQKECVKQWMEGCTHGMLVISAAQRGCGVTTLLECFVRELGLDAIWIHQPIRGARAFLEDATRGRRTALGQKKVLILDPFDAICTEATCAADIQEYLKKGLSRVPVIVAGHHLRVNRSKVTDITKKLDARAVTWVEFPPLDVHKVLALLGPSAASLWESTGGDLRNCLQSQRFGDLRAVKDDRVDGFDAIARIVHAEPSLGLRDAARLVEGDANMIAGGVFENYPTWSSLASCERVSDAMSVADIFEKAMYTKNAWGLSGPHSACIAAVTLEPRAKKLAMEKYGTVWSRENNKKTKEKSLQKVGMTAQEVALIRTILVAAVARGDVETVRRFAAQYGGADTVLAIMRLWKTKYTLAMHKKFTS